MVGIHEAGHAIASIYEFKICPKFAVSRTADDNGGFCHIDFPEYNTKESLLKEIVVFVSGYMAEIIIFGEDNLTAGSVSDLEKTTKIALKLVKEYGMNGMPLIYSIPNFRISDSAICNNNDELDSIAVSIVADCVKKSKSILEDNMELLLQLGNFLSTNSKIEMKEIKELVDKYGSYVPEYKTKDNYYDYKSLLKEKIEKLKNIK